MYRSMHFTKADKAAVRSPDERAYVAAPKIPATPAGLYGLTARRINTDADLDRLTFRHMIILAGLV